ncbi:MAG: S8 family serine peptidase [Thermoanaerobaculales bacterium]|nr:S8 family serine peptidase [Thermoanaerobaculales bacterium]
MQARFAFRLVVVCALAAVVTVAPAAGAGEKIKVESLDDIPRFSYPVEGSVVDLITSDERFGEFAVKVRADIEDVLARYDINDASTLQGYYAILSRLDLMEGDFESALARVEQIGELETKEAARLMNGLFTRAWIAATAEVDPEEDFEAFAAAFATHLEALAGALPWDVVQDSIKEAKGRAEVFSTESFVLGIAQSQVDPAVEAAGAVSSDLVSTVVALRTMLTMSLPLNQEVVEVYSGMISANKVEKENIWAERGYIVGPDEGVGPVIVGIWDSGVDVDVFNGLLWVNPTDAEDGEDNDGNGFVDDVHGLAFDREGAPSPFLLHPEGDMEGRVDEAMSFTKGFMDLTSAIDSPEASALKRHLAGVEPAKVNDFIEALSFAALYMHGTHVAGIAVEGNPFARIMVARLSFDYHNPPAPLSVETGTAIAESFRRTVEYFRTHGVRVVNMSWGWSLKEIESGLEANGVGETPQERAELAAKILDIMSTGLYQSMVAAKDILFVAAAGNSDNDVEFDQMIPSSYDMENLMVVGAVDQAGDPTGFTSQGENVRLYANGFEIESYVPGGGRMAASGTSMSAPAVVNLAAKILAVDPSLSPTQVIDRIMKGATPRDGDEDFLLLHPRNTMLSVEAEEVEKPKVRNLRPRKIPSANE